MGCFLLLPFFLLRFGLLARLGPGALGRAARFAPMAGRERIAYWIYQLSTAGLILSLLFLSLRQIPLWLLVLGGLAYGAGLLLLAASLVSFARPGEGGLCCHGVYRWSRNPMYVAYFLFFLGCAGLTHSWVLLGLTLVFQISGHWIILAEERACLAQFGAAYQRYQAQVPRYF